MPHQCTNCGYVFADGSKEMLTGCPGCNGNKFQYHPGEVPDQPTQDEPPERPGESGVTGTVGKAAAKVRDLVADDEPDRARQQTSGSPSRPQTATDSASHSAEQQTAATETTASGDDTPPETASAESTPDSSTRSNATPSSADPPTDESARDSEEVPDRDDEDVAQQSARSEMVSENDLPESSERASSTERPPSPDRGRVVSEPDSDERPDMEALREELNSQFESIRIVSPGKYELNLMELYDREEYIIALQENGRYVIEVPDAWEVENADETD